MNIRKLIKGALYAAAFFSPSSQSAAAAQQKLKQNKIEVEVTGVTSAPDFRSVSNGLPAACKDFTLMTPDDPATAKVILLGEVHSLDSVCKKAKFDCTKALLKKQSGAAKEKISILVEEYPHDKQIDCAELGLDQVAADCRGWSIAQYGQTTNEPEMRYIVINRHMNDLDSSFNQIFARPVSQQMLTALKYLEDLKKLAQTEINKHKNNHKKAFDKFKIKHPKVPFKNFSSQSLASVPQLEILIEELSGLQQQINRGKQSVKEVWKNFKNKHENSRVHDEYYDFQERQDILAKSIKERVKHADIVVVHAGGSHVNIKSKYNEFIKDREIVANMTGVVTSFFKDLGQFAHPNRYAVLDCEDNKFYHAIKKASRTEGHKGVRKFRA